MIYTAVSRRTAASNVAERCRSRLPPSSRGVATFCDGCQRQRLTSSTTALRRAARRSLPKRGCDTRGDDVTTRSGRPCASSSRYVPFDLRPVNCRRARDVIRQSSASIGGGKDAPSQRRGGKGRKTRANQAGSHQSGGRGIVAVILYLAAS
jgi:hypothetical protein